MKIAGNVLVLTIALEHLGFLILEMFLWTTPLGLKVFGMTAEVAAQTSALAANQGLYNGFLAAGLFWSLFASSQEFRFSLKIFFLSCVLLAGLYGWWTVSPTILLVQAVPAAIALALIVSKKKSL